MTKNLTVIPHNRRFGSGIHSPLRSWTKNFNIAGLEMGSVRSIVGYANESLAIGRALQCGYNLFFKAWRDSPYDAVLDFKGTLFRIEIKGTQSPSLNVTSGGRAGKQIIKGMEAEDRTHILNRNDADFLIGVSGIDGSCYILPIDVVKIMDQKTIAVSKLKDYKEKWGIFIGTSNFHSIDILHGFLNKTIAELKKICSTHSITFSLPTRSSYTKKEILVLSIWSYIYSKVG